MLRQQVVKPNFLYFMTIITTVAQYTLYTIQLLFVHKEDVAWNSLGFIIQSQPTGIKTTMTVSNRLRFNTSCWYCAPGNILHLKHIVRLDTHKHWIVLMERTIYQTLSTVPSVSKYNAGNIIRTINYLHEDSCHNQRFQEDSGNHLTSMSTECVYIYNTTHWWSITDLEALTSWHKDTWNLHFISIEYVHSLHMYSSC